MIRYLWAPWRAVYLKKVNERVCFICRAVRPKRDKSHLVIARTRLSVCLMNRYPYNSGHLLIAPVRHRANLEDLTGAEILDLFNRLKEMKERLRRVLKPEGFNVGINLGRVAGAGLLGHIHIHLVPRWAGDTNFMPVLSGTKVVSQALETLYQKLTAAEVVSGAGVYAGCPRPGGPPRRSKR